MTVEKTPVNLPNIFLAMLKAGVEIDRHASDLYVPVTNESTAILEMYPLNKSNAERFKSKIDGRPHYDIPFAFAPAWPDCADQKHLWNLHKAVSTLDSLQGQGGVQAGQDRAAALGKALNAMAGVCGITLREPLSIDANGEFSLVVMPKDGRNPDHYGCGQFGEEFAGAMTGYGPRCGTEPMTTPMTPESGWCRMNHFSAEKMVSAFYQKKIAEIDVDVSKIVGRELVTTGQHIGSVTAIENGVVHQNAGAGRIAYHDAAKLSRIPAVGEVIDVKYNQAGQGIVAPQRETRGKGRGD